MNNIPNFNFFLKLAEAAKIESLPYFRTEIVINNKELIGFDPVTIADRSVEKALRAIITNDRPDDGILGEELPDYQTDHQGVWIIDPIDGTRAFISGLPVWGTLVGYTYAGKAIAGMMAQPFTNELYYSCGDGSFLCHNDNIKKQLKTRKCLNLNDAILFSTGPEIFKENNKKAFEGLTEQVKLTRYGTDCYAFAMLASGFVDLVIETGLKQYDIAALIPIIEQAGGVITQWDGGPAELAGNIIAAATPELHQAAMMKLQKR